MVTFFSGHSYFSYIIGVMTVVRFLLRSEVSVHLVNTNDLLKDTMRNMKLIVFLQLNVRLREAIHLIFCCRYDHSKSLYCSDK